VGSFLVGAVLGFGWGQADAINPYVLPNTWSVVETQSYSALLVLAGSINFKSVKKAVTDVEKAVTKASETKTPPGATAPAPDAMPPQPPVEVPRRQP
jgi:hypothetical protein